MPPTIEKRVCLPERLHTLRFWSCAPARMARRIDPADAEAEADAEAGAGAGVAADLDAPGPVERAGASAKLLPFGAAARCCARGGRGGPSGVVPVAVPVPAPRRGGEASNSCSSAARNCARSSELDIVGFALARAPTCNLGEEAHGTAAVGSFPT